MILQNFLMNNDWIENSILDIMNHPIIVSISIVGNIFLIESILSIDNAAVLSSMILDLKVEDRKKALRYGLFGAYFFRGLCLFFTSKLIRIWWLKPLGGIYLIYIGVKYFFYQKFYKKNDRKNILPITSSFWKSIFFIEIMDLAFSIDNILAAVALSENLILIFLGVFTGILSMRWVTKIFVKLIEKKPFLKDSAFSVIFLLGIKLIFSFFYKKYFFIFERFFPFLTVMIFLFPIFMSYIFQKKTE
ncbi:TerC family protein [Blattabacterium cuenoti]|uniref:TerC family protein n=1 Tax=Blattabacterium cuenoti TaxID=1653831 RepID=UPI001EEB99D4|nr:DUF475 domain-containing protein [Blattabacterium cuenoti]